MTHPRTTFRVLSSRFGAMARAIQLSEGSIRLTVNQQRLAKIATSPSYCHPQHELGERS
jgi:hypothetical protein